MSDIEMGGTTSSQASVKLETDIRIDSESPTTEAYLEFDFSPSRSSSPSQTSTMDVPSRRDRAPGDRLQAIPRSKVVESGADYAEIFNELQIKPEHHDEIVTGILHHIRVKRMKHLKTATDAMIKDLSHVFIRGYCKILYQTEPSKWLVPESQLRLEGKDRLTFAHNKYDVDGPNAHLYRILEPMWWTMRDIVFEVKPPAKRRGPIPKRNIDDLQKGDGVDSDVYHGDNDTELDVQLPREKSFVPRGRGRPPKAAPKVRFEEKQKQTLNRIEQAIDSSKNNSARRQRHYMTAEQTDQAVCELISRLHEIRCQSNLDTFASSWETHLARLEEIEEFDEFKNDIAATPVNGARVKASSKGTVPYTDAGEIRGRGKKSPDRLPVTSAEGHSPLAVSLRRPRSALANEPFNTRGPPSPLDQLALARTTFLPSSLSVYITSAPPVHPYKDKSYHWPDAPIGVTDCKRLFDGIGQRVAVRKIYSYSLSYGWNDIMRLIENDAEGRRHGFSELRRDIADAAKQGVTKWRLKVLVAGEVPGYQRKA